MGVEAAAERAARKLRLAVGAGDADRARSVLDAISLRHREFEAEVRVKEAVAPHHALRRIVVPGHAVDRVQELVAVADTGAGALALAGKRIGALHPIVAQWISPRPSRHIALGGHGHGAVE